MYQFSGHCYSDLPKLYSAMAASCPTFSNGLTIICTPNNDGYIVTRYDGVTSSTYQVNPQVIDCQVDTQQVLELNGMVLLILFTGFCFMLMKRSIR